MPATLIDGASVATLLVERIAVLASRFAAQAGRKPGLTVCIVGDDPASAVYVRAKEKRASKAGFESRVLRFDASLSQADLLRTIAALNAEEATDGILVQLPLPQGMRERAIIEAIDPQKDVDGFHTENSGKLLCGIDDGFVPCTPFGCLHLLRRYFTEQGDTLEGKRALVLGRSNIVGKPMALLLLAEHASVTIAHSRTRDLPDLCREAEILVAAVGRANFVQGDWIRKAAVVVDVGINREGGKLVGDVRFAEAQKRAAAITPVPGGVGPMTIAMLLWNTLVSAHRRAGLHTPRLEAEQD